MGRIHTTEWMKIDLSSFDTRRKTMIRGNPVELCVSPYDIPQAVRAIIDISEKYLTIEFKYLTEENTIERKESDSITYILGVRSSRLYGIKFNIEELTEGKPLKHKITRRDVAFGAINVLLRESPQEAPKDNYELVMDALRAKESELLATA